MIRTLHSANSLFCLLLGGLLNCLLFWLVWNKSTPEMHVYSRILLQTCVTDLLLLVASDLTQSIFFVDGPTTLALINGHLMAQMPSLTIRNISYTLWNFCYNFSVLGLCVQFVYRYLVLNRECSISVRAYACILLAMALVEGAIFTAFYFIACPEAGHDVLRTENKLFMELLRLEPNETVYLGIYADGNDVRWLLLIMLIFWINNFAYLLIVVTGYLMIRYLRKHAARMSRQQVQVNRQISLNLICMASLPIFMQVLNTFCQLVIVAQERPSLFQYYAEMLITIPMNWLPVLNPLIILLAVKHFRRIVLRMLGSRWAKLESSSMISQRRKPLMLNGEGVSSSSQNGADAANAGASREEKGEKPHRHSSRNPAPTDRHRLVQQSPDKPISKAINVLEDQSL